ncbi:MAG TPA: tetratricopeptide repeat protein [Candidatus Limnocylindrales bacterium]|nr:tetratricopeptide repeat protein [Candidatus Limnocylindrales bacterium]
MGRSLFFGLAILFFAVSLLGQQPQAQVQEPVSDPAILLRVPPPPPDATFQELEHRGDELRSQKAYLDAVDYYRAATQKNDTAQLHNKIGIAYFLLHRDRDARREYQSAIKLNKEYSEAYNNLGALYYNQRRYGPSIKEYKRALKINEENASFHKNLGTAYFSEKDFQGASREYQRAMALDPSIFDRQPSGGVSINLISSNDLGHFHYVMAEMYGQQGNVERCRYYLSKANEEGYPIRDALRDSGFASLRKDPQFVSFLRSLKTPSVDPN